MSSPCIHVSLHVRTLGTTRTGHVLIIPVFQSIAALQVLLLIYFFVSVVNKLSAIQSHCVKALVLVYSVRPCPLVFFQKFIV